MATSIAWGSKQTATTAGARRYLGYGVHSNRTATTNDRTSRHRVAEASARLCELHCEWQKRNGTLGQIRFGIDRLSIDGARETIAEATGAGDFASGNQTVRSVGLNVPVQGGDRLIAWVQGDDSTGFSVSPQYLQVQAVLR